VNFDPATGVFTGITAAITFESVTTTASSPDSVEVDDIFEMADQAVLGEEEKLWIIVDRLDVAFADNHDLERNALRALFKVYRGLQRFDNISLKIFLRTDIWYSITKAGFREASHITRDTTLKWTPSALLQLIIRRLLQNDELVELFGITDLSELLSDAEAQRKIFDSVFPPRITSGNSRVPTLEWCLKQVSDGSGFSAPRELIHLLGEALEIQISRLEAGERDSTDGTLVDQTCLWQALDQVSKDRLAKTLYAEYPEERPFVESLEGGKAQQDIASLCSRWNETHEKAYEIAARLVDIGFFDHTYPNASEFFIAPVYHPALRISSG
jgi:hypothetical protein